VSLFTTGLEKTSDYNSCDTFSNWVDLMHHMALVDITITIFAPMLIIFLANVLISIKLTKKAYNARRFKPLSVGQSFHIDDKSVTVQVSSIEAKPKQTIVFIKNVAPKKILTLMSGDLKRSRCNIDSMSISNVSKIRQIKTYSKTTRMLLIISTIFFCLNVPMALSKLRYLVTSVIETSSLPILSSKIDYAPASYSSSELLAGTNETTEATTEMDQIIERFSCYLYYLNYSINVVLYTLNGEKFKKTMVRFFKRKIIRNILINRI
jgi:hypothetical protein